MSEFEILKSGFSYGGSTTPKQNIRISDQHYRYRIVVMLLLLLRGAKLTTPMATTITTARRVFSNDAYCCAVVYISEGRNTTLLDSLANAARTTAARGAGLIRQFRDPTYHRTGFTIGGRCPYSVAEASLEVSRRALRAIDLRKHEASHPRIGVVDHVSVHPLGEGAQQGAQETGMAIARALAEEEGLPVLLYGDLNRGRGLAEVSDIAVHQIRLLV